MRQSLTGASLFLENVDKLMRETKAATADFSVNLRNQVTIGTDKHGRERIRKRNVLFIHQEDGEFVGKVNTRDASGELVPRRVVFDKRRRAWHIVSGLTG